MCTATYLPLSPAGFILTHSRDEKRLRPAALPPRTVSLHDQRVTFPQDPQGQGTWIATSVQTTLCILNGAFIAHQPQPPYKHSRGLVVVHYFDYPSVDAFAEDYDFRGIEPFTLLVMEAGRLVELRWNGHRLFVHEKDPQQPHIWSSVTLYAPDVIEKRERWFRDWLSQHSKPTVSGIRQFHHAAGDGDPENSLRMNRRAAFGQGALLTLSLTSVVHDEAGLDMVYDDFTQPISYRQLLNPPAYAAA